jgi:hypothetical protein
MGNLSGLNVDLSPLKTRIQGLYDQWRVGPERTLREGEPGVVRLREIERKIAEFEELKATSVPDLDALKREIDALMGEASTGAGRSANAVTSTVRNELRAEIIRVDPEYKAIMEGYEAAITLEKELAKDLSLTSNATQQATLRKLSQSLRDGVNANFGGRARQVQQLDPQLTNLIAGRTLAPAVPHGMARFATIPAAGAVGMALAGPKGLAAHGWSVRLLWVPVGLLEAPPRWSRTQDKCLALSQRAMSVLPARVPEWRVQWYKGWIKLGV